MRSERIARRLVRWLGADGRNALRGWLALETRDTMPALVERFDETRVAVLAPHSDDEVIGCGGTLLRHVQAGAEVHVIVLTDGRWGDAGLFAAGITPDERARRQDALVRAREAESRSAAARLGFRAVHFLRRVDGALDADDATVTALRRVLGEIAPQLVYLPFVFDLHEDHWQTNRVFAAAADPWPAGAPPLVRGYEVWTPLPANRVVDIGAQLGAKLDALACFATQLRDQDYRRMVEGLAAYRSAGPMGGCGHAEAFHEVGLAGYRRLVAAAALRPRRAANTGRGAR